MADNDNIQHGIDDNPSGDAEKGAKLGGVGGLVAGAIAGSAAGPVGTIVGAIVGGVAGAAASGVAVAAVDRMDNDNTVTGIGKGETYKSDYSSHESDWRNDYNSNYSSTGQPYEGNYEHAYRYGHDLATNDQYRGKAWNDVQDTARTDWERSNPGTWDNYRQPIQSSWERSTGQGNGTPGIQTGGHANDGSADTRGIMEKTADTLTGDQYDDKTGKRVDGGNLDPAGDGPNSGYAYADQPGIQTGGHAVDGSPDTRGITEKMADTVTGDKYDDKTGKRID